MSNRKKRPYIRLTAAVICAAAVMVSSAQAAFADVPSNAYYKTAVDWAVSEGITSGQDSNHFAPNNVCTRGQIVTFLWRSEGSPKRRSLCPYTDVKSTDYYYDAVCWASLHGITSGVSQTEFAPDKPVTRAQVASFLHRIASRPSVQDGISFSDVSSSAYYTEAVRWAASKGITTGTSATTFSPNKGCTRAEIVTFLYRSNHTENTVPVENETEIENDAKPGVTDKDGAYNALFKAVTQFEKEVDMRPYHINESTLYDIMYNVSHDSYFYDPNGDARTASAYIKTRETNGEIADVGIAFSYSYAASTYERQLKKYQQLRDKISDIIDETIKPGMSDYDKAKALHDYLCNTTDYDHRVDNGNMPFQSYTAYGALLNQYAVCSGYGYAYELLLQEVGIPVEYVSGKAKGMNHGWNIVQIDGEWYHVDATWDTPSRSDGDAPYMTYFLKSDNYFLSHGHSLWKSSHSCTDTRYDAITA